MKENNELKREVKNLSNKLERCYNTKITFDHMLNNKRSYGDMSGIGFNKSKIKGKRCGKRRYEREMKKQEQEKLSHSCASSAMKWDILQMVAQTLRSSRR